MSVLNECVKWVCGKLELGQGSCIVTPDHQIQPSLVISQALPTDIIKWRW